jgi:PhzF family phenazine biosynthesis protein
MLKVFQINAFTSKPFSGNPALVCPLDQWLDDARMQKIAAESGLTCAFFVGCAGDYTVRWFTPKSEIQGICGHGTLAAGHVILEELHDLSEEIRFHVPAGDLFVRRQAGGYVLDLPALNPAPSFRPDKLHETFGRQPQMILGGLDFIAVFQTQQDIVEFEPDYTMMKQLPLRAVIVTAEGDDTDFVLRWFAPKQGEREDTGITGSAFCSLVPYWAARIGRTELKARQLSQRGGVIDCQLKADRVRLSCAAIKYMEGLIYL